MSGANYQFPQTRWSLVLTAKAGDTDAGREALAELCRVYWFPLYAYARRGGRSPEEAEDATQGFFEHLLTGERIEKVADQSRGRLRSFLLTSMQNFLRNQQRQERAEKRGGGTAVVALDAVQAEHRYALEPQDGETPESLYERRWALEVLDLTFARLRHEYEQAGRLKDYECLKDTFGKGKSGKSYGEIGEELGITEGAARVASHRLRKQFRALLRETISDTVATEEEIDVEMKHLQEVLLD